MMFGTQPFNYTNPNNFYTNNSSPSNTSSCSSSNKSSSVLSMHEMNELNGVNGVGGAPNIFNYNLAPSADNELNIENLLINRSGPIGFGYFGNAAAANCYLNAAAVAAAAAFKSNQTSSSSSSSSSSTSSFSNSNGLINDGQLSITPNSTSISGPSSNGLNKSVDYQNYNDSSKSHKNMSYQGYIKGENSWKLESKKGKLFEYLALKFVFCLNCLILNREIEQ